MILTQQRVLVYNLGIGREGKHQDSSGPSQGLLTLVKGDGSREEIRLVLFWGKPDRSQVVIRFQSGACVTVTPGT